MPKGLSVWTIYNRPSDFPNEFVARCWIGEQPTGSIVIAQSLEDVRRIMMEMNLTCLARDERDDPVIVETWL